MREVAVTDPATCPVLKDLRGPEEVTSRLSDEDLAGLLDRLYKGLDTPHPDPASIGWYDVRVEESRRRAARR